MLWRASSPTRQYPRSFIEPCLPTNGQAVPSGPQWVHEIKHDGYRFICRLDRGSTRLAPEVITAAQISQILFANECESERVDLMCRRLIAEGRIKRGGEGTVASPFAYEPKRTISS